MDAAAGRATSPVTREVEMANHWVDDDDGYSLEGSFWGAKVWSDGEDDVWFWEAWSDGDDSLEIEGDSVDGEESSKSKAMRKAEKWLGSLGIEMD
jgi:hypothetical protein